MSLDFAYANFKIIDTLLVAKWIFPFLPVKSMYAVVLCYPLFSITKRTPIVEIGDVL
jgi:hypothetical protein